MIEKEDNLVLVLCVAAAVTTEETSAAPEDDGKDVDESGITPKDIQLVMDQAGCTR